MTGPCARWFGTVAVFLGALESGAQSLVQIDLRDAPAEAVYSRYLGSLGNGRFGVPVCGGHDCDGDGHPDVALAGVAADPFGRPGAGNVTVVWGAGPVLGERLNTEGVANERVLQIAGSAVLEVSGAEIWMDDVDGDGLGDLLIGRQNFSPTTNRRGAGALTILFGGAALRQLSRDREWLDLLNPPPGLERLEVWGGGAYDRLGIWMRTGDIDGDGVVDIAIGADEVNGEGARNQGEVYLVRGGAHLRQASVIDLSTYPPVALGEQVMRIQPPPGSANAHFGATVQLGDLDGNGRAELLVAATLDRAGAALRLPNAPLGTGVSRGGLGRGTAYILWDELFESERWFAVAEYQVTGVGESVSVLRGGLRNVRFGEELLAGGDYDGDGKPDLFIGDLKGMSRNGSAAGLGHVFFDGARLRQRDLNVDAWPEELRQTVIEGISAGALSADVAGWGDFDEDGADDLVICSPHAHPFSRLNAGSVHVLYGPADDWPEVIDLAANALSEGVRIVHVVGGRGNTQVDLGDTLGYSLAVADGNGDGTLDIIVNEMQGNGARLLDVGNLILLSGRAMLPPPVVVSPASMRLERELEGEIRLHWMGRWRTRYAVEKSEDLAAWQRVGDWMVAGSGGPMAFLDESPAEGKASRYYRVLSETLPNDG